MRDPFKYSILGNLRTTALAGLLAIGGAQAAGVSGIWQTADGDYLMLLRDARATVAAVRMKPDLTVRDVLLGTRVANRLLLRAVGSGADETWTVSEDRLDGPGAGSATPLIRGTAGSALDGIWRRDDEPDSYFMVLDGIAANGGLAVVSELKLQSDGRFSSTVHLGKINGNFFSDTQRGFINIQLKEGKLSTTLTRREIDHATQETARTVSAGVTTQHTSSRVITGSDPERTATNSVGGSGPGTGTSTGSGTGTSTDEPKGCAGDFGNIQKQVKESMLAKLAERNISPGWITNKVRIGDKSTFDGGTVPLYRIDYLTNARTNIKPTLAANSQPTKIRFSCSAGTSTSGSVVGIDTATVNAACASMWQQGADVNPTNAHVGITGMNAEDISFEVSSAQTEQSAAGGMVDVRAFIRLDADNNFNIGTNTTDDPYYMTKTNCNVDAIMDSASYTPYPQWTAASVGASSFSGTPEVVFCFDPQRKDSMASVYKAGLYAWDLKGYDGDMQIPMTLGVNLGDITQVNYTGTTSTGDPVNLRITLPQVSVRSVNRLFETGVSGNTIYRYKDKNVSTWSVNSTVDAVLTYYGSPLTDPQVAVGDGLQRELFPILENTAYNKFAVELAVADPFSNSTAKTMTVAEGMANGVKNMAAVGLAALGIGGFKPVPRPTQEVQNELWSDVKFVGVMPNTYQGTEFCEWVAYDPETGAPAHQECTTAATTARSNYVTYTIEAPFCGN